MKKKIFFLLLLTLMPIFAKADHIYNVDVDVNILYDGSAQITEVWDVQADSGTEWYKQLYTLDEYHATVTNFYVYMDNYPLIQKEWNTNESISQKNGYYGINYVKNGIELCFGKGDFNRHTFKLNYTISNYIFNVDDAQVLYWTILPSTTQDRFSVNVHSYYDFPDDMEIYGFGYTGRVYISDGKIIMNSQKELIDNKVVLLAKFPKNTFYTNNSNQKYHKFSDVLKRAKVNSMLGAIIVAVTFIFVFLIFYVTFKLIILNGYGYKDNKRINKKNIPMYRDIPCNKDIYYANVLLSLNSLNYRNTNIFGAIILKWISSDKIKFIKDPEGKNNSIDLRNAAKFDNQMETELFDMLYEASNDGILKSKELEKWCRKNYRKFLQLFDDNKKEYIEQLKKEGHIYKRNNRHECRSKNVMDNTLYDDSMKLYGLESYLKEFSKIDTKEVIEVKLWDEYLMFAYIFGIANKVAAQLKNLYPEVMENPQMDYNTIVFVNNISTRSVSAASAARSAAENYSSGGGGFSSGGGGGGSFGGGGGMGGR
jgi:uncharacterized membrane protein YgcG